MNTVTFEKGEVEMLRDYFYENLLYEIGSSYVRGRKQTIWQLICPAKDENSAKKHLEDAIKKFNEKKHQFRLMYEIKNCSVENHWDMFPHDTDDDMFKLEIILTLFS